MSADRKYFLIAGESPVMDAVRQYDEMFEGRKAALDALKETFKCDKLMTDCYLEFRGCAFNNGLPEGFRYDSKSGYAYPNKRTKLGKEYAKAIAELPGSTTPWYFAGTLGKEYSHLGGGRFTWTVYRKYGDAVILSVPVECDVQPEGCIELKMSEYYQYVERHEAQEAQAA